MPGVTEGEKWTSRGSHMSRYDTYYSTEMSPQRRRDAKSTSGSIYSNGYSTEPNSDLSEYYPTYLLEHLATFSVGELYGICNPKDGLRRLLQMEKSSGIWTQKMQMRLERKWVVIIDNENGDVVERFPMPLISEPTSYTSNDPRELYNNIVVFIVKDDPSSKSHNPPEMHIFQCARVSAQEVVNEMKMFINGKWKPSPKENGRHLPPPPQNPPPEPPLNGVNVREQVSLFNAVAAAAASPPKGDGLAQRMSSPSYQPKLEERALSYSNDETSSISSEKYERDVAILNHCFDDIERFIARLQHAAAAFKELERRQKSRKNKKKDMGDGMLSMRAKPPTEREFIDIFQKFKLSFNLLAKLKSHIHDPNAPELIHFLFTPLALIVDAAKESNYATTLPSRVVAPLLTRDAVELLMNCCTSKESDLWHSLGDSWLIPREQWKGFEGHFQPVFSDGWAPENPFAESRPTHRLRREDASHEEPESTRAASRQERESRYGSEFYYSERGEKEAPAPHPSELSHSTFEGRYYDAQPADTPRRELFESSRNGAVTPLSEFHEVRSDFSADSIDPQHQFEGRQRQWAEELATKGAKVVQVMYPRTANNDKELTVVRGEYLEVLDDSRKWWKARNSHGQVAHVPHTIVGPPSVSEEDGFHNPIYGTRTNGTKEPFYAHDSDSPSKSPPSENGHKERAPAAAPIQPAPADWVRRERQGKKDSATASSSAAANVSTLQDLLHQELKDRINSNGKPTKGSGSSQARSCLITAQSSPEEVQLWLSAKGFSARTLQILQNVRGDALFGVTKGKMENDLGQEEGIRLFNQIAIQKNMCGFRTFPESELSSALEARRRKIDPDERKASFDSISSFTANL